MSNNVFICGHRNPDTDSVCAAAVYAHLKNSVENRTRHYIPIRCGNVNTQTRFIFERSSVEIPALHHDINPRVTSVTRTEYPILYPGDSILKAIKILDEHNLSVLPVIDTDKKFKGLLSIQEITRFFIQDNLDHRPDYRFVLNNFEKAIPGFFLKRGEEDQFTAPIMIGAMPYDISIERIAMIPGGRPLLVTGLRTNLVSYAVKNNFPAIVLTGCEDDSLNPGDFESYNGSIFISRIDTAETVRRLRLSIQVENIMNTAPEIIEAHTPFKEAKDILVHSTYRGLPVMKDGTYQGIVSRRCFIDKPKTLLIMVDHNEIDQSVTGADDAEICEIIDHHKIGSIKTKQPIFMDIRPVGSTCTIVYTLAQQSGIQLPSEYALLLLSGILSDTVILKSPTTTAVDRAAAEELARICNTSIQNWGGEIFSHTSSLKSDNYEDLVMNDFKEYTEFGYRIGISQIEVITFQDLPEVEEELLYAMESVRSKISLNWLLVLVTNIMKEESILLSTEQEKLEKALAYPATGAHRFKLEGVLSRKKQLLPEVLRVLEEAAGK